MKTKAIYTDLEWYDVKRDQICGDMGFAFCDRGETIQPIENKEEYLESINSYINSDDCEDYGLANNVAVYSAVEADVLFDDADADNKDLSLGTIDFTTINRIAIFICTEDEAVADKIAKKYNCDRVYYGKNHSL